MDKRLRIPSLQPKWRPYELCDILNKAGVRAPAEKVAAHMATVSANFRHTVTCYRRRVTSHHPPVLCTISENLRA